MYVSTNHAYPSTDVKAWSHPQTFHYISHVARLWLSAVCSLICFRFYLRKYLTSTQTRWKEVERMRMRSLMTQAPRFCGVYMLWSINLGQSVLMPYQLSVSSYATDNQTLLVLQCQSLSYLHTVEKSKWSTISHWGAERVWLARLRSNIAAIPWPCTKQANPRNYSVGYKTTPYI